MVQEIKKDKNVLNKVDGFMNKVYETPEVFVGSTSKVKDSMTDIMSNLYQLAKKNETMVTETETDALDSLVTKDFDSEQIWAQIQLLNDPVLSELESKINGFVKSKEDIDIIKTTTNKRKIQYDDQDSDLESLQDDYQGSEDEDQDSEEDDDDANLDNLELEEDDDDEDDLKDLESDNENYSLQDDDEDEDEDLKDGDDSLDEGIDSDSIKSTKSNKSNKSNTTKNNNNKKNIEFLNVKEMEKFLDDEDDNEYQRREDEENDDDDFELGDSEEEDGGLDLPDVELDEEEKELDSILDKYMEKNQMELQSQSSKSKSKQQKSKDVANMKFEDFFADPDQDDEDNEDDFGLDHDDYEDEDDDEQLEDDQVIGSEEEEEEDNDTQQKEESETEEPTLPAEELSAFEKKASRIQERIKKLEQENLKKKEWTMIGETSAKERPLDSLLGESLDYEHTQRSAPTITEDTNKSIEDIIKKRILEKNFDDVIRKTEKEFKENYKKKVELNDEKSQEGLGDVYEKTYMKQVLGVEETDELKQKHIKIYELYNKLCYKLDSLTNFQYTPKMIKNKELNITTASAVTMEEKVPVATSTSTMVAPEEVYFKKNADEKGDSELTKEDRTKIRKGIKKQWSHEKQEKESQERHKEKTDPNYAKRTSESKAMAELKQAKNVTIVDTKKSQVKSGDTRSGAFFHTIQTHEDNRKKGIEDPNSLKSKKKQKLDSISSKQFKL